MSLKKFRLKIKETIATIVAEEKYFQVAEAEVLFQRLVLEDYLSRHPDFLFSLQPIAPCKEAPEIIQLMAKASFTAKVGPMASVAGAIAYLAVRAMVRHGAKQVIFENGGDIAMYISEPVVVGLFAGEKFRNLAFRIRPRKTIFGLATSSGTMGHSLSFGQAEAVTVFAADPILADALATALGNEIKKENPKEMEQTINKFLKIGAEGIVVVKGDFIGLGGKLPELILATSPDELITRT
ncbi:MAG: UPF0280 family protein [Candidatus Aminicenantes bacterium]|nr:UPF0280 family protein [Candidatus Aminicenantes bacterium]